MGFDQQIRDSVRAMTPLEVAKSLQNRPAPRQITARAHRINPEIVHDFAQALRKVEALTVGTRLEKREEQEPERFDEATGPMPDEDPYQTAIDEQWVDERGGVGS